MSSDEARKYMCPRDFEQLQEISSLRQSLEFRSFEDDLTTAPSMRNPADGDHAILGFPLTHCSGSFSFQ